MAEFTNAIFGQPNSSGGGDTPAEIKVKYESNADTNAFTDSEKEIVGDVDIAMQSTARLTGGAVTATLGGTTFDVTAGTGKFINGDIRTDVSWSAQTNIPITNILTQPATVIGINSNGNVFQQGLPISAEDFRNNIYLEGVLHTTGVVEGIQDAFLALDVNVAAQVSDLARAIGAINLTGNGLSANGVNLNIDKAAGTLKSHLSNYSNNPKDPSTVTLPQVNATPFLTTWRDGSGGYIVSPGVIANLPIGEYDDGTGGTLNPNGVVANNRFTNFHCYVTIQGTLVFQYGEAIYNNISDAFEGADDENFTLNPAVAGSLNLGWISVKGNATDLSDPTQALFRSGPLITGGAGAGAIFNAQAVYDVSTQPQVVTDSTLGAMTYQNGEGDDTTDTIVFKNNSGTTVASIRGDGVPTASTDLATKDYVDNNSGGGSSYAFYAYANQTQNLTTTFTTVEFNTKDYDINSVFNTGTYTFTAPINGIYQFNVSNIMSGTTAGDNVILLLTKNGSLTIKNFSTLANAGKTFQGGTTQPSLLAGDTIEARIVNTTASRGTTGGGTSTEFSGHLVQAT